MATLIRTEDGPSAYLELVKAVRDHGVKRSPHGEATRDLGLTVIEIENPYRATPLGVGRGLSRAIMAAETVQLVGAFSDASLMPTGFEPYKEADGRFWGAYGDRIGYQLLEIVRKLKQDPNTRQAIVSLWNPMLDNIPFKHDYPCTLGMGFSTNDAGQLDIDVMMRSNDVWLGVPYDWCQFSVMQQTVASLLGRDVGVYRHVVLSMHMYERDVVKTFEKLHTEPEEIETDAFPRSLARPSDSPLQVIQRCRQLPYVDGHYVPSEHWYRNALTRGFPRASA